MTLKDWNITNPDALLCKNDVIVKIRYRKQANRCTVTLQADNTLHVQLHEPLTAIATGQAAAFIGKTWCWEGELSNRRKRKLIKAAFTQKPYEQDVSALVMCERRVRQKGR